MTKSTLVNVQCKTCIKINGDGPFFLLIGIPSRSFPVSASIKCLCSPNGVHIARFPDVYLYQTEDSKSKGILGSSGFMALRDCLLESIAGASHHLFLV